MMIIHNQPKKEKEKEKERGYDDKRVEKRKMTIDDSNGIY